MGIAVRNDLSASRTTHLICAERKGKKFEMALKIGAEKIKIVDRKWVDECHRNGKF